jgi:histidinol phosphatase-like PHP family hydrolase
MDVEAVLEGLEVTGVALEINGALDRLDASSEVARQAMGRDIVFAIDTDSHHTRDLRRMDYGVEYARRGWVTGERVVNTWDAGRLQEWIAARRG